VKGRKGKSQCGTSRNSQETPKGEEIGIAVNPTPGALTHGDVTALYPLRGTIKGSASGGGKVFANAVQWRNLSYHQGKMVIRQSRAGKNETSRPPDSERISARATRGKLKRTSEKDCNQGTEGLSWAKKGESGGEESASVANDNKNWDGPASRRISDRFSYGSETTAKRMAERGAVRVRPGEMLSKD